MPWWLRDSQDEHSFEHDEPSEPADTSAADGATRDGDSDDSDDAPRRRRRRRSSRRRSRRRTGADDSSAGDSGAARGTKAEASSPARDTGGRAAPTKTSDDETDDGRPTRRRRRRRRNKRDGDPDDRKRENRERRHADPDTRTDSDTTQEPDDREPSQRPRRTQRPQQPQRPQRASRRGTPPQARKARRPKEPDTASERPDRILAVPEADLPNDLVYAVPESRVTLNDERRIAMFVDLENVALGVRDSSIRAFEVNLILERLLEKGKIIAKKAYADWERYSEFKRAFHLAAIELIDIPQKRYSGKNSADIKMVVDAMDLCYSKEHVDTFVLVSGDSDFSPLVSKLKENDKYVIGIGVKNSSSDLLIDNCDEFIFYEDVWRDAVSSPRLDDMPKKEAEAFQLMSDAIVALNRENKDVIWGSMVKQTMKRKKPSFNEGYHGYSTFSELLEEAEDKGLIKLSKDQRSGNYIIKEFAGANARVDDKQNGDEQSNDRSGDRGSNGRGSNSRGSNDRGRSGGRGRSRGGRRGGRSRSSR